PTRRASIRQSEHVTPRGAARSSWSRPAFARGSVIQKPARMVQFGPRPDASFRLKSSENKTVPGAGPPPLPASAPASAPPPSAPPPVPASAPASGVAPPASAPASGVIPPASTPASDAPPSVPPPARAVKVKSSNQTPAFRDVRPAAPAAVSACAETSVTASFVDPFTAAVRDTGPAPCAVNANVAQLPRSATPLGTSPRTVTEPLRQ